MEDITDEHDPLLRGLKATHPGELLREDAAVFDKSRAIASPLGISRQTLWVLNEKQPVTPEMALLPANSAATALMWINMQRAYDRIAGRKLV